MMAPPFFVTSFAERDLNLQPSLRESDALPIELSASVRVWLRTRNLQHVTLILYQLSYTHGDSDERHRRYERADHQGTQS